ncbi:MAG: PRC-barrel domain containing protein [Protaetiibacter sp.]
MILSDLLGSEVRDADGLLLGRVIDARFRLEGTTSPSRARLVGIIVSPRSVLSYLGYERTVASRPVILDRLLRWMHRGSFLVLWEDVARIQRERVELRPGYRREPSALDPELRRDEAEADAGTT